MALAVETETSADPEWAQVARGPKAFDPDEVGDEDVEEVHELSEPLTDETEKKH